MRARLAALVNPNIDEDEFDGTEERTMQPDQLRALAVAAVEVRPATRNKPHVRVLQGRTLWSKPDTTPLDCRGRGSTQTKSQ